MHLYLHGNEPRDAYEAREFVEEYMQRPRFVDPQRSVTRRPADDFENSIHKVATGIEFRSGMTRIGLISAVLDALATEKGKRGWVALDLHPEFYFTKYERCIPGLRLAIVLREPLEAIAASLYWRTYPSRTASAARDLSYSGILWRLSAACGVALQRSRENGVCFLDGGRILSGCSGFAELPVDPGQEPYNNHPAFFTSRTENDRVVFYCPDGHWRPLLEQGEVLSINRWRADFWSHGRTNYLDGEHTLSFPGTRKLPWRIASMVPAFAKSAIDTIYHPRAAALRLARGVKAWA